MSKFLPHDALHFIPLNFFCSGTRARYVATHMDNCVYICDGRTDVKVCRWDNIERWWILFRVPCQFLHNYDTAKWSKQFFLPLANRDIGRLIIRGPEWRAVKERTIWRIKFHGCKLINHVSYVPNVSFIAHTFDYFILYHIFLLISRSELKYVRVQILILIFPKRINLSTPNTYILRWRWSLVERRKWNRETTFSCE